MEKIICTKFALDDLKKIHEFVSHDSLFYANKLVDTITERTFVLDTFPKSGRVVPEFNNETVRELIVGNYRIVYFLEKNLIYVLRVHHSAKILNKLQ